MEVIKVEKVILVECPHCDEPIMVMESDLNCCIFRCGVFKDTFIQVNPHETKFNCDFYKLEDKIYGCGKPFKIMINENKTYEAVECDYE